MAADRPSQTLADYVTIVFSPVLIMGLVGSLVFFLLEVFYTTGGEWRQRLQWIVFFFVFGAVLTARISMMGEIAGRAGLYGSILALLTYIAMQRFVEYPPGVRELSFLVNLLLVGVIWWCAHRLTWDCTNIDEDTDMSGEGLLQAAGLQERPAPADDEAEEDEEERPDAKKGDSRAPSGWIERYRRYREERQKKRTLGVWVVYFSLAALPIFGLGQSLIPATAPERRRFAFWMMTVYVGCALGLLLTTCFLGLRRYLRQKRLRMPAAMTAMWLVSGGGLVAVLLLLGALMPRPYSEYPLIQFQRPADSAKQQANRFAPKGDSPAEGKGQPGAARPDGKAPGEKTGDKGAEQGRDRDGKDGPKGDGKADGSKGQGSSSGEKEGKDANRQDNDPSRRRPSGKQAKTDRQEKSSASGKTEQGTEPAPQPGPTPPSPPGALQRAVERLAPVLKWLVFAALAVLVVVAVFRGLLGFLANFTDWARHLLAAWRRFWENLFGGREAVGADEEEDDEEEVAGESLSPFAAFSNPFADGRAARLSPRRLVRYTFAALEAWAREHHLARRGDETALEFLSRLGEEVPALEAESRTLGDLHARAEYSPGALPADTVEQVRAVWKQLDRVHVAPLSS